MNRYRAFIFLGLAVVIALITSVMVFSWLRAQVNVPKAEAATVKTMVAVPTADLGWGTKLTREMFDLIEYPAGSLPEGHFTNIDGINDRVLLVDIKRNELLLESKLAPLDGKTGGVTAVTDPNKRAMSVKVDDVIGVAGFIKPADRVDVMVTIEPTGGGQAKTMSKMILENLKVLAAGTQMERKGKDEEPKPVQVITVEVDVEEAEKLALASTQGRLRLALRNPLNAEKILTQGATVGSLLSSYRPKPKASVGDGDASYRVEVIKGDIRKEIKF
jgi:pilus assembly protein CpaB